MELEEEKKAQAEKEKRLQEQAKKIENLSSMVLCSNRDENRDPYKKVRIMIFNQYYLLLSMNVIFLKILVTTFKYFYWSYNCLNILKLHTNW